jgi:hypothetical protein
MTEELEREYSSFQEKHAALNFKHVKRRGACNCLRTSKHFNI